MMKQAPLQPLKCRTAWISDLHLGYRGCKTEFLLNFLNNLECDFLYLVGDIIDVQHMEEKGFYWPDSHAKVLEVIMSMAQNGTKVVYIPGNHDDVFREYDGQSFGDIELKNKCVHQNIDGRRLLMMHGDEFDEALNHNRLVSLIGDVTNNMALYLNRHLHFAHTKLGLPYFSYSAFIKRKVKNIINHSATIQNAVMAEAKRAGVDGIVCGHQHQAQIRNINGTLYCNDGDWVESCTTMVEQYDGSLELLRWRETVTLLDALPPLSTSAPNIPTIADAQAA